MLRTLKAVSLKSTKVLSTTTASIFSSSTTTTTTTRMASSSSSSPAPDSYLELDPFAHRQFNNPDYKGTKFSGDMVEFTSAINKAWIEAGKPLSEGYAPFCKHFFLPNFTDATLPVIEITDDNKHLLVSDYVSRRPEELAVLERWFPMESITPQKASWLDVILYSREQIHAEAAAMGMTSDIKSDWGIISVKAQDVGHELPMNPITIMRNSLGKEEGGSGVSIDPKKYAASVEYWKTHATLS